MKKFKNFIYLTTLVVILSSCSGVKESFTNQNKNSSDEFLVQKKSPLVMPPDFNQLPIPSSELDENILENDNDFEKLIINSKTETFDSETETESFKNFEEFIIKKIKKN